MILTNEEIQVLMKNLQAFGMFDLMDRIEGLAEIKAEEPVKQGLCVVCYEHTQVPGSCCGVGISFEGAIEEDQ